MKNLEQIRAKNALAKAHIPIPGTLGGEVVKKVPPLIMNHGLLATGAYAFADKEGYGEVLNRIAEHLADDEIKLLPVTYAKTKEGLMKYLSQEADSAQLKLCTAEAMAWLEYACRFIKKD